MINFKPLEFYFTNQIIPLQNPLLIICRDSILVGSRIFILTSTSNHNGTSLTLTLVNTDQNVESLFINHGFRSIEIARFRIDVDIYIEVEGRDVEGVLSYRNFRLSLNDQPEIFNTEMIPDGSTLSTIFPIHYDPFNRLQGMNLEGLNHHNTFTFNNTEGASIFVLSNPHILELPPYLITTSTTSILVVGFWKTSEMKLLYPRLVTAYGNIEWFLTTSHQVTFHYSNYNILAFELYEAKFILTSTSINKTRYVLPIGNIDNSIISLIIPSNVKSGTYNFKLQINSNQNSIESSQLILLDNGFYNYYFWKKRIIIYSVIAIACLYFMINTYMIPNEDSLDIMELGLFDQIDFKWKQIIFNLLNFIFGSVFLTSLSQLYKLRKSK